MTSVREAARALLESLDEVEASGTIIVWDKYAAARAATRAALNAPPPGREDVWAKAVEIWMDGLEVGADLGAYTIRDRLIVEVLAMFEARQPRDEDDLKKSIHVEAEVFPSDEAWCVQFWDRDEGNIWLVTFNAENAEELAEEYARAKAGGFYRKPPPPPPQLKVVK